MAEVKKKPGPGIAISGCKCCYCTKLLTVPYLTSPPQIGGVYYCSSCGVNTNATWANSVISQPIKTQKARGIFAIGAECGYQGAFSGLHMPPVLGWFAVADPIPDSCATAGFARPCPPSPEHGFVESKVIKTKAELEQMRLETLAANPDSEILVMEAIDAKLNVVWTPHMLAVGPGNDGATSGKGAVSVPLAGVSNISDALLKRAGVAEGSGPFVEAVLGDTDTWYITQLRGGPAGKIGLDFLPGERVCTSIVQTNGEDLLEWAKMVKGFAKDDGVFVYHPTGTVVDHFSVHCRANGVPIFITKPPVLGEVYTPTEKVEPHDPHQVALGIAIGEGLTRDHCDFEAMTALSLLALHNSDALRGESSFWIGVGSALLCKLGPAALEAEARHAHNCYHGMKCKPDIYHFYISKSLSFLRARLSRITQLLHYGWGDPAKHAGGYGGPKWALCGAALTPMFNAMRRVVQEESSDAVVELIGALNIAINQAHNGGWWLNKFIAVQAYNELPAGSVHWYAVATSAIWAASQRRKLAEGALERVKRQTALWPVETRIAPLRWRKAAIAVQPGAFVLKLKASTVPTPREIRVEITGALAKSLLDTVGRVQIAPGTIDIVTKGGEKLNVWTETPLAVAARNQHNGWK